MAFALPQLGIGLGMCVTSFQAEMFSELPKYGLMTTQMSAAATADILITGPLVYYLNKSKVAGTRRTNSLINRLIVWTVNTALLTGVVETAQVISWVSATKTLIFLPFHLILAKLYTCSMLAMLNGRRGLRQTFDEPTHTLPRHRSSIVISLHGDDTGPVLNETGPLEVRAWYGHRRLAYGEVMINSFRTPPIRNLRCQLRCRCFPSGPDEM
ncbi:hypothetical protein EDB86DRAFT_2085822 [Lactarius hatsudake]|nr:hypothetical protein EDB86DRAFT_2085822 [Lactarius hatsudake]